MAFDNDKSSLVPEPPPPRPARREAAIEAAMRRFDGIDERQPAAPSTSWARRHRPQFGMLVTASLIAAIGLPLALMTIRDRIPIPTGELASPATAESRSASAPAVEIQGGPPPAARVAEAPSVPPPPAAPAPILAERGDALAFGESRQLAKSVAASPPAAVAPAPAPPPQPPPPPAAAEKVAQEAAQGSVVVTGSRVAAAPTSSVDREKRNRSASVAAGRTAAMDAARAPDFVLQDRSYETFLTRLQSAVRANDRNAVVQMIAFPLRVNFKGRSQLYRDARAVGRDYDRIFTPQVRRAIVGQRFDQLFSRDQGVMIGNGEVWFDHSPAGPVRIQAVNP